MLLTLRTAILLKQLDLARELLARGVSVHLPARIMSIMNEACLPGKYSLPLFALLLKHADPAKLNERVHGRKLPLHVVCLEPGFADREKRVLALLNAGADPNLDIVSDTKGRCPLAVAAIMNNAIECALVLLKKGREHKGHY